MALASTSKAVEIKIYRPAEKIHVPEMELMHHIVWWQMELVGHGFLLIKD